jgi:rod shape-determining protein MreD
VLLLLLLYEFVMFWTDGIIGYPVTTWTRWIPVFTSALLWPVVVAILDTWNRRNR